MGTRRTGDWVIGARMMIERVNVNLVWVGDVVTRQGCPSTVVICLIDYRGRTCILAPPTIYR